MGVAYSFLRMLFTDNPVRDEEDRNILLHVNFNDAQSLTFVLNNCENIHDFYTAQGNTFEIRVVTHGLGLHLLREDTSPVKERLQGMVADMPSLSFYACTNTQDRMEKAEGKRPELIPEAIMVRAGIPEIIELQRAGWTYIKP
ncbi:MAG: DsrE family protein [Rhodospirillales bacterium]|nr:DsrE family protein [Rhodospirillales bacterium]